MPSHAENLLKTSDMLLEGAQAGAASRRRAVSTAYYALFNRLCLLCAHRLIGRYEPTPMHWRAFRGLEHKQVKDALARSDEFRTQLGSPFSELQEMRVWADYSWSSHPDDDKARLRTRFALSEARRYVQIARAAVAFIDALDKPARRRLATLLLVRDRR